MRGCIFVAASSAIGLAVASMAVVAASNCKIAQIEEWPVRLERNKLIVDGAINGQQIGVILDTGTSRSLILRSTAVRLGLKLEKVSGYRIFGIGGETAVEVAFVSEFKIRQAVRKGWRVLVAGEHEVGVGSAFLLGEDFFHLADVEFDLAHNAVRLYQTEDCEGVSLAYWTTDVVAGEADIEAIDDDHPRIILTVQINGRPVKAMLDSGAATSMLTRSAAASLGVTPETPGVVAQGSTFGVGPKVVDTWIGPFESFAIGNEIIRNTTIRFADLWEGTTYTEVGRRIPKHIGGEQAMLLGVDFLRAHRVLIAHSQRKIYFTYVGGPVFQRPTQVPATATDEQCLDSCKSANSPGSSQTRADQEQRSSALGSSCQSSLDCPQWSVCAGSPPRCRKGQAGDGCTFSGDCEGKLVCLGYPSITDPKKCQ